jgi:restriction system protein
MISGNGATMKETAVWGIHAGKTGDADSLFLKSNVVAIGWPEMGNLSKIACEREDYKAAVTKAYPNAKPGAIPNYAGQLLRFACEIQIGDLVLYPSKQDRMVHFGQVEGGYVYAPQASAAYPNQR